jgi:16S rRNA processing protein RimM
VRFRPDNPDSESIHTLERIFLSDEDAKSGAAKSREYRLNKVTPLGRGTIRLMLEGITDIDQAEALKGKTVFADLRDLPPPEAHEFYYHEAVGCEVVLTDGRRIGIIEEVFSAGANDVFIVRDGSKEVLVPVIADVVKAIDIAGRRVTIEAVPGLLD